MLPFTVLFLDHNISDIKSRQPNFAYLAMYMFLNSVTAGVFNFDLFSLSFSHDGVPSFMFIVLSMCIHKQ